MTTLNELLQTEVILHYRAPWMAKIACGEWIGAPETNDTTVVTCLSCKRTKAYKEEIRHREWPMFEREDGMRLIRQGTRVQTRRILNSNNSRVLGIDGPLNLNEINIQHLARLGRVVCRWSVGDTLWVKKSKMSTRKNAPLLRIDKIRLEEVGQIGAEDVGREGFRQGEKPWEWEFDKRTFYSPTAQEAYMAWWAVTMRRQGHWTPADLVWVVDFTRFSPKEDLWPGEKRRN